MFVPELYLNLLMYADRNIFGSFSELFGNLWKLSENVRKHSFGLRTTFENTLKRNFVSPRDHVISSTSFGFCSSTYRSVPGVVLVKEEDEKTSEKPQTKDRRVSFASQTFGIRITAWLFTLW